MEVPGGSNLRGWYGALTRRVEHVEEIDEEGDQAQMRIVVLRDPVTEPGSQQSPAHVRGGRREQATTTKGIDSPHSRPSEQEVDQAEASRSQKSLLVVEAALFEDCGGVGGGGVDTAHLLANHDDTRGLGGRADSRDGEELDETGEEVALRLDAGCTNQCVL